MNKLIACFLFALALGAQTKTNLTDIRPPAAPAAPVYLWGMYPGIGLIALDPAGFTLDKAVTPPVLRAVSVAPPATATAALLWDDVFPYAGVLSFPATAAPVGRLYVFKNGLLMEEKIDYTVSLSSPPTVTMLPPQPLGVGDRIRLLYQR